MCVMVYQRLRLQPSTLDALVDGPVTGPEAFRGSDPIDSFCGLWDARI